MSVRREHHGVRNASAQFCRNMTLRLGPDLVHDAVPFAVGETRRIFPAFDLAFEASIRPEVMAVRGELEPLRIRSQAAREERLEAQSAVLNDQSSGKARLSKVERR